ncbi:PREDICTED: testis-expressed sequence 30 protein [Nanorana parkeri]|uniref:testis-expressed sequence 30 protein n=1 Tax=Nanorana parkeri TaxID=125878 RepID=UPI000854A9D0|nr:PREDICTED: testis-expressed sequence 30 protein [Nanorana parkeri]
MGDYTEEKIKILFGKKSLDAILSIPKDHGNVVNGVILTHGAGGDMNFAHLVSMARYLASHGLLCLRFTCKGLNLVYRTKAYNAVVVYMKSLDDYNIGDIFLAGRSMGSRVAAHVMRGACEEGDGAIQGLICLSYPLHSPNAKGMLRDEDILHITKPMLFISGSVDEMCDRALMMKTISKMKAPVQIHWVENANHGMSTKGKTMDDVMTEINEHTLSWIQDTLKL